MIVSKMLSKEAHVLIPKTSNCYTAKYNLDYQ